MLGKHQLLVIEIAETALGIGYGGQAIGNAVYRWEKHGDRVMLRSCGATHDESPAVNGAWDQCLTPAAAEHGRGSPAAHLLWLSGFTSITIHVHCDPEPAHAP